MAFTDSRDVGPGATMSENYNWYVFVISKKSLKDTAFCFKITQILEDSVHKNTTKLIPVLHKVDIKMVPDLIRWVTMLCTSDSKFCDHIYQTVIGGPVTMVEKMPCGDVVTGLCWAYLINYMKMALFLRTPSNEGSLDFRGRIKAFLRNNNLLCGCPDKVYILWPSSCMITDAIEIVANKNPPDERIVKLGSLPMVYANTGGQLNRSFTFSVYKHTRPHTKQSTCFIAEYCTPMGCLYQMGTKYGFAGINKEDLSSQGQNFMKAFESFTSLPAVKEQLGDFQKHTQFMFYDDSKKPLIEVIEEQLSQETSLEFAEDCLVLTR
ncbi:stimulator of interferon genes protein-like [Dreissena polymorpha]|nr:stimulator of interferon genes protein-like [Dreissena polymorpha]